MRRNAKNGLEKSGKALETAKTRRPRRVRRRGLFRRAARAERNNQRRERKNIYYPLFHAKSSLTRNPPLVCRIIPDLLQKAMRPKFFRAHCF